MLNFVTSNITPLSAIIMLVTMAWCMRTTTDITMSKTNGLYSIYKVCAKVFYVTFGFNLLVFMVVYSLNGFSIFDLLFYISVVIFIRQTLLASKKKQIAYEFLDNMKWCKKTGILLSFFYMIFWLSKGIFILI